MKTAQEIMSDQVLIVEKNTSIHNLIKLFIDHKISSVPVVDENKSLVGIVTKTDVLGYFLDIDLEKSVKNVLQDILDCTPAYVTESILTEKESTVEDIMTSTPKTADENTPIDVLAKTMVEHNIHRIIIMRDGNVCGIVSTLDILYFVAGIEKHG